MVIKVKQTDGKMGIVPIDFIGFIYEWKDYTVIAFKNHELINIMVTNTIDELFEAITGVK